MKLLVLLATLAVLEIVAANIFSAPYETILGFGVYRALVVATKGLPANVLAGCKGSGIYGSCNFGEYSNAVYDGKAPSTATSMTDISDLDKAANALRPSNSGATRRMEAWAILPNKFAKGQKPKFESVFQALSDELRQARVQVGDSAILKELGLVQGALDRSIDARMKDLAVRHLANIDQATSDLGYKWKVSRTGRSNFFGSFDKLDWPKTLSNSAIPQDQLKNLQAKMLDNTYKIGTTKVVKAYASHADAIVASLKIRDQVKNPPVDKC